MTLFFLYNPSNYSWAGDSTDRGTRGGGYRKKKHHKDLEEEIEKEQEQEQKEQVDDSEIDIPETIVPTLPLSLLAPIRSISSYNSLLSDTINARIAANKKAQAEAQKLTLAKARKDAILAIAAENEAKALRAKALADKAREELLARRAAEAERQAKAAAEEAARRARIIAEEAARQARIAAERARLAAEKAARELEAEESEVIKVALNFLQ